MSAKIGGELPTTRLMDRRSRQVILDFLAADPDIGAFLAANEQFTLDDIRAALAVSASAARREDVDRGREEAASEPPQGLPEPDGPMNKGSVFRSLLAPLKPGKLLDLGAEKRGFPITAAHLGWQVTSVGAREGDSSAVEEPDPETATLEREVTWLESDILDVPIERRAFDLIAIHGILHHLSLTDQVALLRRCAGTPLLIDAKVANDVVGSEGHYEGILTREQVDGGEIPAFMLTEESLIRLARDCGYPIVLATRPPHRRDFTFYLCLPKNWNPPGAGGKGRSRRLARRDGFERAPDRQPPLGAESE